jgi:hypothetical protein
MKINALKGKLLVTALEGGSRIINGIIIPDDNGKSEGIRPRWGQVYAAGEDITEVTTGQWVLVENGRWTRMVEVKDDNGERVKLWGVEWPQSVLLVSDEFPEEAAIFSQFTST